MTDGVSLDGRRLVVPAGGKRLPRVPEALSSVIARVSPSCGRGRWVVQSATDALLGGNVIHWTRRAIEPAGLAPGGGDLFRIAVPRGLAPAFDGVAVTVIDSGVRAAHRVEFIGRHVPELRRAPDPERVALAWRVTETTAEAHSTSEGRRAAYREQPYDAAAAIAAHDDRAAGWTRGGTDGA